MYRMLPATNKLEAIKSIVDAMTENPNWLLECNSKEFATAIVTGKHSIHFFHIF